MDVQHHASWMHADARMDGCMDAWMHAWMRIYIMLYVASLPVATLAVVEWGPQWDSLG